MGRVITYKRVLALLLVLGFSHHSRAEYMLLVARSHPAPGGDYPVLRFTFDGTGPLNPIPEIPSTLLDDPTYFAFDTNGELFVANRHLNSVRGEGSISRFTFDGCEDFTAGERITGNELEWVHGLAMSPWGELFAANYVNRKISRFTFSAGGLAVPHGTIETDRVNNLCLVFAPNGDLISSHGLQGLQRFVFDPDTGEVVSRHTIEVPGDSHGLAFDSHGELFIADRNGGVNRVIFDAAGNPVSNGTIALSAEEGPVGVAFSPEDELFVTSHFDGGITRFIFDDAGNAIPNGFVGINQLTGAAVTICCPPPPPHAPWSFVHITDPHIGGCPEDDPNKAEEELAAAIDDIIKEDPDLILVTGDIADYGCTFASTSHGLYNRYLSAIQNATDVGIQVYTLPGNHDRLKPGADEDYPCLLGAHHYYYYINPKLPSAIEVFSDGYSFRHKELLFIGLDSGPGFPPAEGLYEEQISHLETLDNCTPKVVFMHHPGIDLDDGPLDEDVSIGSYKEKFLNWCDSTGVQLVLAGHSHQDHVYDSDEVDWWDMPEAAPYPLYIQTPSVTSCKTVPIVHDHRGYRMINVIWGGARTYGYTLLQGRKKITASSYSPTNLHVYDSLGNHVGAIQDAQAERGIPHSFYFTHTVVTTDEGVQVFPEKVIVFDPYDEYLYELVGKEQGTYRLDIRSTEDDDSAIMFTARNIPTSAGAKHVYTVDWSALSTGEEGVLLKIDADGDGVFERTVIADEDLTAAEFALQTETVVDFEPDVLNLASRAKVVTVYIELPEGFDVSGIDPSSVKLNDSVRALSKPVQIGDYDEDEVPDLMVKFDCAQVAGTLAAGRQTVILTGRLADGSLFAGIDTIRVIGSGGAAATEPESESVMSQESTAPKQKKAPPTETEEADTVASEASIVREGVAFMLLEACQAIGELGPENLDNEESAIELIDTIDTMFGMLDDGMYFEALAVLDSDVLQRMDGCASVGQPDEDDWITSVEGQALVYPLVVETMELLERLI